MAVAILDSGALIAIERGDREIGALIKAAARGGDVVITSSACIAETWRNPARQARLTQALKGIAEYALDPVAARRCGALLARSGTSDIADAAIALLARRGDLVLTSDEDDIAHLLHAAGTRARIRAV